MLQSLFYKSFVPSLLLIIFLTSLFSGCVNSSNESQNTRDDNKWPDTPVLVTDATMDELIRTYPIFIVDCWAAWCGPCLTMAPIIEDLAKETKGTFVFGKLNIDENPRMPVNYTIEVIPTFLVFKNGVLVDRIVGAMSKDLFLEKIRPYQ